MSTANAHIHPCWLRRRPWPCLHRIRTQTCWQRRRVCLSIRRGRPLARQVSGRRRLGDAIDRHHWLLTHGLRLCPCLLGRLGHRRICRERLAWDQGRLPGTRPLRGRRSWRCWPSCCGSGLRRTAGHVSTASGLRHVRRHFWCRGHRRRGLRAIRFPLSTSLQSPRRQGKGRASPGIDVRIGSGGEIYVAVRRGPRLKGGA